MVGKPYLAFAPLAVYTFPLNPRPDRPPPTDLYAILRSDGQRRDISLGPNPTAATFYRKLAEHLPGEQIRTLIQQWKDEQPNTRSQAPSINRSEPPSSGATPTDRSEPLSSGATPNERSNNHEDPTL